MSKEQILNTKNALGNPLKAYTIVSYVAGKPDKGNVNWVTLQTLLGMTDFNDAEVDALADLEVGGTPLKLDFVEPVGDEPEGSTYMLITRVN